jgi:serine phosphatase RsbU (regulator of sigma subunit)
LQPVRSWYVVNAGLLQATLLFASLPDEEIEHLSATLHKVEVVPNTILIREGEVGDRFYLILDGEVEIVKALGTDDERLLRIERAGEFVGEMSLLNSDGLRTASVRTRTATRVLEMTRADLDGLLSRHPTVAYDLARVLSMRLQAADNATIRDLHEKNRRLTEAYQHLQAMQAQIVEKEKLERELEVARQIQESMLPQSMPHLDGFDFGARSAPAHAVGGDFFDFIPLSRDRLGIVIGDVSGKGVPAALVMALTRSLVRAEARRGVTLRETIKRVNRHLLAVNETAMFVTLLYGVLHRRRHAFEYVRAGHEIPLVTSSSGEVSRPHPGPGMSLGVLDDPLLDEQVITVPRGSSLLLYTDGVTDAVDAQGRLFGLERLKEALHASREAAAQLLCDRLLEAVLEYGGTTPQVDDATLVAVRAH